MGEGAEVWGGVEDNSQAVRRRNFSGLGVFLLKPHLKLISSNIFWGGMAYAIYWTGKRCVQGIVSHKPTKMVFFVSIFLPRLMFLPLLTVLLPSQISSYCRAMEL